MSIFLLMSTSLNLLNKSYSLLLYIQCLQCSFQFVSGSVIGVFCWSFCDFGPSFEVTDANGEEPREVFISNITKVILKAIDLYFVIVMKFVI